MRHSRFVLLAVSLTTAGLLTQSRISLANADELRSDSYSIQFGNFNMTSGEKSSLNYRVTDTVGQTGAGPFGQYGSTAFFLGSGFQYIYQIDSFRFTVSQTAIDLGTLTPGVFNTASHTLSVTTRGAGGYGVYAYELHPLRHSNGVDFIADTTCNSGNCTQTTATAWTNPAAVGFGFNMTGNDIPTDFVDGTYFRQFANQASSEPMQLIMSATTIAQNRVATVNYKAAISGSQAAGSYQTGIVYVAVPNY